MATKKSSASVKNAKVKSPKDISFNPSQNGSYLIRFSKQNSKAGFKVLLKGGMFHRVPEGFVVYPKHKELLVKEEVPFEVVKK